MIPNYVTSGFLTADVIISDTSLISAPRKSMDLHKILRNIEEDSVARYYMDPIRVMSRDARGRIPNKYFLNTYSEFNTGFALDIYRDCMGDGSIYKISPMIWLLDMYKPNFVLDPFAGYGERLCACLIRQVRYMGCSDHAPSVHQLRRIITHGYMADESNYFIYDKGFKLFEFDDEYDFVYFYLPSMPAEDTTIERAISVLSVLWNSVDTGAKLVVHANVHTTYMLKDIYTFMLTQESSEPIIHKLDKNGEIGSEIYVWVKPPNIGLVTTKLVKENRNTLTLTSEKSIASIGMPSYIRNFHGDMHYVIMDKNEDMIDALISSLFSGTKLIVHKPAGYRSLPDKSGVEVHEYSIDYETELANTKVMYPYLLIPTGLKTDIYKECLVVAMQRTFPYMDTPPSRVWISESNSIVIRALLSMWPTTTFLVITKSNIRADIPLVQKRRVIMYTDTSLTPITAKKAHGLSSDYVFVVNA